MTPVWGLPVPAWPGDAGGRGVASGAQCGCCGNAVSLPPLSALTGFLPVQLQIEDLTRKLRTGDLGIPPNPEDRSGPSPGSARCGAPHPWGSRAGPGRPRGPGSRHPPPPRGHLLVLLLRRGVDVVSGCGQVDLVSRGVWVDLASASLTSSGGRGGGLYTPPCSGGKGPDLGLSSPPRPQFPMFPPDWVEIPPLWGGRSPVLFPWRGGGKERGKFCNLGHFCPRFPLISPEFG